MSRTEFWAGRDWHSLHVRPCGLCCIWAPWQGRSPGKKLIPRARRNITSGLKSCLRDPPKPLRVRVPIQSYPLRMLYQSCWPRKVAAYRHNEADYQREIPYARRFNRSQLVCYTMCHMDRVQRFFLWAPLCRIRHCSCASSRKRRIARSRIRWWKSKKSLPPTGV